MTTPEPLSGLFAAVDLGRLTATVEERPLPRPAPRRRVPHRRGPRRIGRHLAQNNRWRDVVFIERRSPLIDQTQETTRDHPA